MKTLLACMTTEEHADDILAAAIPLARRHSAHLIGLHVIEAIAVYPGVIIHVPDGVYTDIAESQKASAKAIHEIFEERVRAEDFVAEWREVHAHSMTAAGRMVEAAHTADLVIMAQADKTTDRADQYHAQEHVIRQSGRPVMVVPGGYRGEVIGQTVVIGWSATREATRAVHEAIPVMGEGAKAYIVAVSDAENITHESATELARMLDRHGIQAEVVQRTARQQDIASMLQREAMERGADLIVTGAFGHSRIYDFVIGAVTLDLMKSADIPVLYSR